MSDPDYGVDLSCTSDLNPLLIDVTGTDLMNQVALHRWMGRTGSLLSNPVDNTIDVRDFVSAGITPADLPRIRGQAAAALTGDQRIYSATVAASYDPKTNTLTLNGVGVGSDGPFNLTVAVTSVTVELIAP